jgi:CxxC-x17-CxxC domain-containing protein
MQDKTLKCRDCGGEFVFTAGEQEFYAQKGFNNQPTRCPQCRAAHKASRGDAVPGAVRPAPAVPERRDRVMYSAVCSGCGKATEVPFQPRADRPVYCHECFSAQRTQADQRPRPAVNNELSFIPDLAMVDREAKLGGRDRRGPAKDKGRERGRGGRKGEWEEEDW